MDLHQKLRRVHGTKVGVGSGNARLCFCRDCEISGDKKTERKTARSKLRRIDRDSIKGGQDV